MNKSYTNTDNQRRNKTKEKGYYRKKYKNTYRRELGALLMETDIQLTKAFCFGNVRNS